MIKQALIYTLLFISIPTILVFLANYSLPFLENHHNYQDFLFYSDFLIIFLSAIAAFIIIYRNNAKNRRIFQKIKQNNEVTRLSNERFEIVAKATSDTIWDRNLQTNSILWNKGIQGIFGYSSHQLNTSYDWWFERIHPEDHLRMSINLQLIIDEKTERWQNQYRFLCADGSYKYVLDRGFLVTDSNGLPVRMIGAMQDITKQKLEELRLKLLEKVITSTKDAIIIAATNKKQLLIPNVLYVNPAFTTITGFEATDVLHKSVKSFVSIEGIASNFNGLSSALKNRTEFQFESFNSKKNGEKYWVKFYLIPIDADDGEHLHWIAIQREITDQKRKEKEKEHLIKELIQNNKDLKQFSYITSHNLRAPLSNLNGLLKLLDEIEITDHEVSEILDGFKTSTNTLNETINDLTKVIVIKDSVAIALENVNVNTVFEKVKKELASQILASNPQFETNFESAPNVTSNAIYIESILLNLLSNSLKFKADNRNLMVKIVTSETTDYFELTFEDNGIGIDLTLNKDKIFGLYQRFHDLPDSKGFGLYLIKSQIESLNGSIAVTSDLHKGTKFTIQLKKGKQDA